MERKRGLEIARVAICVLTCGGAAMFSLRARWYFTGHRYSPYRYSDVGGVYLALADGMIAFGCGALLGAILASHFRTGTTGLKPWPWAVPPAIALTYLLIVANFAG